MPEMPDVRVECDEVSINHFKCGHCSNIPWCCIAWYPLYRAITDVFRRFMWWYNAKANTDDCQYIPCPICLMTGRRSKIVECREGCEVER